MHSCNKQEATSNRSLEPALDGAHSMDVYTCLLRQYLFMPSHGIKPVLQNWPGQPVLAWPQPFTVIYRARAGIPSLLIADLAPPLLSAGLGKAVHMDLWSMHATLLLYWPSGCMFRSVYKLRQLLAKALLRVVEIRPYKEPDAAGPCHPQHALIRPSDGLATI